MTPSQIEFERRLMRSDAPAVLDRDLLKRISRLAPSTLSYWMRGAVARGRLIRVLRGLYLNAFRTPAGTPADAAHFLRTDAVVSLNTVLGDAGVLNNPSNAITAVVPLDRGIPAPRLGREQTAVGVFHFFGMPRRVLTAGEPEDRLAAFEYPRTTPERALVDWLYLARSPRSKRGAPPLADMDLELLDQDRLARLMAAVGVEF